MIFKSGEGRKEQEQERRELLLFENSKKKRFLKDKTQKRIKNGVHYSVDVKIGDWDAPYIFSKKNLDREGEEEVRKAS